MSELFEDEEEKESIAEDEFVEVEEVVSNSRQQQRPNADARRRLENLLEEKRLRDELEDFLDY